MAADHTRLSLSAGQGIIIAAGIVLVPEPFCPLQKLQVVLHLTFDQFLDVNGPIDILLGEIY
jgi:hypothetical protein